MLSHTEAVAKAIEVAPTRALTSSATPRPGPEGGPGPAQLASQIRRAPYVPERPLSRPPPAPRPVVFGTYIQQMRSSALELRGDSRNARKCCICVVAWSRKTEQVALAPFFRVSTKRSFG
jgi:hypothetical protein